MTLGEKQRLFPRYAALLINYAYSQGYEVSFGDFFRDARVHGIYGEKKSYSSQYSNHKLKLAFDLNLFKNGKYLTKTEDHRFLGEFWMALDPLCEWGGFGDRKDGNHYSFNHEGRW